jgi:hypothetical protein
MSLLDDLSSATDWMSGLSGGGEATRDDLPPAGPAIGLRARTNTFVATMNGSMEQAWNAFWLKIDGDNIPNYPNTGETPYRSRGPYPVTTILDRVNEYNAVPEAQAFLNYSQWFIPYFECCRNIFNGLYTGQDWKDILAFMQVTENDFTNPQWWDTDGTPNLDLQKKREALLRTSALFGQNAIPYPNAAPPLPKDYTNFFRRMVDHATGNDQGDSNLGTYLSIGAVVAVALGLGFLYLVLRR